MSLIFVLAISLPLVGAGGVLGLSLVPRARPYTRYVALIAVGLTTVLILTFRWMEPVVVVLSLWQPSLLLGSGLTLQVDGAIQPVSFVLSLVTCSSVLVELGRRDDPHPRLAPALLALLSAGLVTLWSANVLTMIVGWAIYDLLQAMASIAAGGSARTAIRGMVLGSLATLLLWAGAMLSVGADSGLWSLMTPSGASLTLWVVAGMLRLWVYPFHLSAPDDLVAAPPLAIPLLLGPIVGWGLWLRISTVNGGFIPSDAWVSTLAGGALALGGLLAWSCESPRRLLPWVGMATNGALLLVAGLAGKSAAAVIVVGSVSWALGITVFFLGDGWRRESLWWNVPALVGLLTLLGLPFTLGFVTAATLLGGLVQGSHVEWGVAFWGVLFGCLFLVPSLVRRLRLSPSVSLPDRREMVVARGVGLGLPTLLLIAAGLYPPLLIGGVAGSAIPSLGSLFAMPGLLGWLLWAVALACGGLLAWQEQALRSRIGLLLGAVHDVLRLEWLYSSVVGALNRGLSVFQVANDVIGGAGALLWSLLLFLLFLLAWGGS
jgi:formate hydrogenlyase subunit 3/multisubunit Na+/H+ antiporter MnhD subunit